jgi:hypothetical protein
MQPTATILPFPSPDASPMAAPCPSSPLVADLLAAARRLIALRERAGPLAAALPPPIRTLSDAMDRDLLLFDIEAAVDELRSAVAAIEPGNTRHRA